MKYPNEAIRVNSSPDEEPFGRLGFSNDVRVAAPAKPSSGCARTSECCGRRRCHPRKVPDLFRPRTIPNLAKRPPRRPAAVDANVC